MHEKRVGPRDERLKGVSGVETPARIRAVFYDTDRFSRTTTPWKPYLTPVLPLLLMTHNYTIGGTIIIGVKN